MASASHNAGLGWEMHFGRLYAPQAPEAMSAFQKQRWPNRGADEPDLNSRWMYVAPDGGSHTLHALPDRDIGTTNQPVSKNNVSRFDTLVYEYDGAGNIWRIGNDRYIYDKANRLRSGTVVQALGSGQKEEYTYDAADNIRTLKRDGGPLVTYNINTSTNRLIGNNDIVYDAAGQMLEVGPYANGHPRFKMEYDPFGMQTRFVSRETSTPVEHLYLYGPGDRRLVTYNTSTGEREFELRGLGDEVLREFSVTGWGSSTGGVGGEGWMHGKDFLYGPEGIFATRSRTGDETFLHKDHLGTPRALTDGDGDLVGRHDYYPFGLEVPRAGQADEPTKKFTGHERDPNGRADYMLGRTYLYPFMRFATPDPARDGWSLYAYTGNNPVNYVDPDGQFFETLWDAANVIAGVVSLVDNLSEGNYLDAAIDAGGVLLDGGATILPFVPGGAGATIKAGRAAGDVIDVVRTVDNVGDTAQAIRQGENAVEAAEAIANPKIYAQLEKQFAKDGPGSIQKALRSAERTLEQHKAKLPGLEHRSQVEGTIRNVESQIETLRVFIKDNNL